MIGKFKYFDKNTLISNSASINNSNLNVIEREFESIFDSKNNVLTKSVDVPNGYVNAHTGRFTNLVVENLSISSLESLLELLGKLVQENGDNLVIEVINSEKYVGDKETIEITRSEVESGGTVNTIKLDDNVKKTIDETDKLANSNKETIELLQKDNYQYNGDNVYTQVLNIKDPVNSVQGTKRLILTEQFINQFNDKLNREEFKDFLDTDFKDVVDTLSNEDKDSINGRLKLVENLLDTLISGNDKDDIINSWNELVDFLDGITQSTEDGATQLKDLIDDSVLYWDDIE